MKLLVFDQFSHGKWRVFIFGTWKPTEYLNPLMIRINWQTLPRIVFSIRSIAICIRTVYSREHSQCIRKSGYICPCPIAVHCRNSKLIKNNMDFILGSLCISVSKSNRLCITIIMHIRISRAKSSVYLLFCSTRYLCTAHHTPSCPRPVRPPSQSIIQHVCKFT